MTYRAELYTPGDFVHTMSRQGEVKIWYVEEGGQLRAATEKEKEKISRAQGG